MKNHQNTGPPIVRFNDRPLQLSFKRGPISHDLRHQRARATSLGPRRATGATGHTHAQGTASIRHPILRAPIATVSPPGRSRPRPLVRRWADLRPGGGAGRVPTCRPGEQAGRHGLVVPPARPAVRGVCRVRGAAGRRHRQQLPGQPGLRVAGGAVGHPFLQRRPHPRRGEGGGHHRRQAFVVVVPGGSAVGAGREAALHLLRFWNAAPAIRNLQCSFRVCARRCRPSSTYVTMIGAQRDDSGCFYNGCPPPRLV